MRRFIWACEKCGAWKGGEDGHGTWGSAVQHHEGCDGEAERVEISEVAPNLTRARDRAEDGSADVRTPVPRPMPTDRIECPECHAHVRLGRATCGVCGTPVAA